jgi:hypothetical protein
MTKQTLVLVIVTALVGAAQVQAEQVVLRLGGVHTDADGQAIADALAALPTVKVATKPTAKEPTAAVAFDPEKTDVGDLAKVVAGAKTPNRDKGTPTAVLVMRYERLDGNALADEVFLPKRVEEGFGKLKGVDAKKCKIDFKARELHLALSDQGGAKLAEIKKGFPGLQLSSPR